MKTVYVLAIVIACLFGVFIIYNSLAEVELRYESYQHWEDLNYSENTYKKLKILSFNSSLLSLPFIAFYALIFSLTFNSIKTTTSKVINILGISFSGIILLVTLLPVVDPGKISFEELSYLLIPYTLAMLAFSIVNLIQVNRLNKSLMQPNQQTIDDIV